MGGIRAVRSLAADAAIEDQTTKEWAAAEAARKAAGPVKKVARRVAKKTSGAAKRSRKLSSPLRQLIIVSFV